MNNTNLKEFQHSDFDSFFKLMREGFPSVEMRSCEDAKNLLYEDLYNIIVDKDENENITAFIANWEFSDFNFIEHFAVDSKIRGSGIGTAMLKAYLNKCNKPIFLEVELPENHVSIRRIEFYKRLGFYLNNFEYDMFFFNGYYIHLDSNKKVPLYFKKPTIKLRSFLSQNQIITQTTKTGR